MSDTKKNILFGILVVIIVVAAGLLGIAAGGFFNKTEVIANGIIINKKGSEQTTKLITSHEEYTDLLNEYKINDVVLFTNNSFNDNDFIVDFIDYEKDLDIKDINLEIEDDGINITYNVNKKVKSSKKYLIYFIPIEKGLMSEINVKSRSFNVK